MVNYKKFNIMEQEKKRQAQAKLILQDFMKENDMKKLIAELFEKAFQAGIFGNYPAHARLNLDMEFGNYEFRLMRQPRGAGKMAAQKDKNVLVKSILQDTAWRRRQADIMDKLSKKRY